MGQSTGLDAHATDPDGDSLTYNWAQTAPGSPQGTFSSQTSATPSWTAPTVAQTTAFVLVVTVSDGKGGTTPCSVKVYAKTSADPSFSADIQPLLIACFGGCHTPNNAPPPLAEYANLVTGHAGALCQGQPYVKPGDPDSSVLFKTIAGASCNVQMPPTPPFLGTDQVNLVRTWISQGAANN